MPQIDISVPNIIGGTSQQSPYIRRLDQCEEMINSYPSIVDGLQKRPHTDYVALIQSGSSASYDAYIHTIDRGDGNIFNLVISTGGITAFDSSGNIMSVVDDTSGYAYLSEGTPLSDFKVVTVQDYTFINNKNVTPGMGTGVTNSGLYSTEGFVFVKQGNYKTKYSLSTKLSTTNVQTGSVVTWNGNSVLGTELNSIDTNAIASGLYRASTGAFTGQAGNQLFTYGGPVGSVFQFIGNTGSLEFMRATDSVGDTVLSVIYNSVLADNTETNSEKTRQLPQICRHGYKLNVLGETASSADDYYIEFVGDNTGTSNLSRGYWRETVAQSILYQIDATTMPHQLVLEDVPGWNQNPVGSPYRFRFQTVDWDDRTVGDVSTNPNPSFIGRPISDIFFFQDRLGIVAEDRICLSEQGEYFNFFRSTLKSLPDTERIDIQVSHNRVVNINHVVPYNKSLILFSDLGQFIIPGETTITSKNISAISVSEYQTSRLVKPASAGRSIYIPYENGNYSGIREFFQTSDLDTFDAVEITNGIPQYIKGNVTAMVVNTLENVLAVLTDEDRSVVYIYKYMWNGNQKVLSSWGKWRFGYPSIDPDIVVYSIAWVNTDLYVLIKRKDGIYLEKIVLSPGYTDEDAEFVTLLDRRLDQSSVTKTYDESINQTTITLPYQLTSTNDYRVIKKDGLRFEVKSLSDYSLNVRGDATNSEFWVGESYTMQVTLTPPVVRFRTESGYLPSGPAFQKCRRGSIFFKNSRYIKLINQIRGRSEYTTYFTGPSLGDPSAILGYIPLSDGELKFTVMGNTSDVIINIYNESPYPSNLIAGNFTIEYKAKSSRVQ